MSFISARRGSARMRPGSERTGADLCPAVEPPDDLRVGRAGGPPPFRIAHLWNVSFRAASVCLISESAGSP